MPIEAKALARPTQPVLMIIMMPFTFSIANGIMFGILSYIILKIFEWRVREIKPVIWVSGAIMIRYIIAG